MLLYWRRECGLLHVVMQEHMQVEASCASAVVSATPAAQVAQQHLPRKYIYMCVILCQGHCGTCPPRAGRCACQRLYVECCFAFKSCVLRGFVCDNMAICMLAGHAGASAATSAQGPAEEAHLGSEREYCSATCSTTVCGASRQPPLATCAPRLACPQVLYILQQVKTPPGACWRSPPHCTSVGWASYLGLLEGCCQEALLPDDLERTPGFNSQALKQPICMICLQQQLLRAKSTLQVGENFNIGMDAWEAFTAALPETAVAYLYVSEHHLLNTSLKKRMRDAIRDNRK